MDKKTLLVSLIILLVIAAGFGAYFWRQSNQEKGQQAEESAVRSVVENFGHALKNVSLLSPTASQDIEDNYKDFLNPALLAQWKEDTSKAIGRLTSSPWPDRIEILSIKQFGSGAYDVSGNIVEVTGVEQTEGGLTVKIKRPIDLGVAKFDDRWLITGVIVGEYIFNDVAAQLRECLPKSDALSHEKCQQLLNNIKNFDECVVAGFSIMKSNPPQCQVLDGNIFIQETNSTWEMAVRAINNCEVEKVFQTHSRIVTLTLKDGNKLIAAEPEIDAVIIITEATKLKCGRIPIGVE
jgi:type II secretory pathway pseudopilin PulG